MRTRRATSELFASPTRERGHCSSKLRRAITVAALLAPTPKRKVQLRPPPSIVVSGRWRKNWRRMSDPSRIVQRLREACYSKVRLGTFKWLITNSPKFASS